MSKELKIGRPDGKSSQMPLLIIFFTVFIDLVGFGIIIPLLPTYAKDLGASGSVVGWLVASYSIMQFVFIPALGRLSDNVGRRPVILFSLAASAIGYLIWGFAGTLPMLFLSRIIAGAGNGNLAVAQAYIADITTPENRAKGMGLFGAAFGLGFTIGPALGGLCVQNGINPGFAAAAFSLISLVFTMIMLPEPQKRSQHGHERFSLNPSFYFKKLAEKSLRYPLAIFFLFTFAFANMETTLVLLTAKQFNFGSAQNAWMFGYIGLIMVFFQGGMLGRLSKKYGEKRLITLGAILTAAGLLLTPATSSVPILYGALALLAVGSGMNTPSNQSILSRLADPKEVGGVLGVGQSLSTLGRILGPIAGGFVFEKLGLAYPYYLGAATMALVFVFSLALPTLSAKVQAQPESAPERDASKVSS